MPKIPSPDKRLTNLPPYRQLGQILVHKGVISDDQLRIALQEQVKTHEPLGRLLVAWAFCLKPPSETCFLRTWDKKA